VNGEQADSGLNLKFPYSIHKKDFALIADKVPAADVMPAGADSMTVNLTTRFLKENAVAATRQLLAPSYIDNEIMGMYNKVWNHDNFGPFLVPAGHYFVLGDNRSYAMDSRYIGPIHADKVVGVVLK